MTDKQTNKQTEYVEERVCEYISVFVWRVTLDDLRVGLCYVLVTNVRTALDTARVLGDVWRHHRQWTDHLTMREREWMNVHWWMNVNEWRIVDEWMQMNKWSSMNECEWINVCWWMNVSDWMIVDEWMWMNKCLLMNECEWINMWYTNSITSLNKIINKGGLYIVKKVFNKRKSYNIKSIRYQQTMTFLV